MKFGCREWQRLLRHSLARSCASAGDHYAGALPRSPQGLSALDLDQRFAGPFVEELRDAQFFQGSIAAILLPTEMAALLFLYAMVLRPV
jgi:hypothetical protein